MRVLLIFSLIFLLGLGHSKGQHGKVNQQVQLDSVRSLIDTASDISVKVKALNRLASHDFINKESKYRDSVKYFAEMALTLASEIEDKDGIAWANMNLSNIAQRTGDIKTSFDHLQSAHSYFKLNKDSTGMGHAMSNLAQLYKDINNIEAAIKIKKEHMNLLRAKGGIWYVYGLESLGRYYQSRKNIDSSDYYLNKGFIELGKIMKSDGEYEMLNPMKNRIGALTCFLMASNDLDENRIDEAKHHIDQMRDFVLHGQSQYRAMEYDRIRALYYSAIGKYDSIQYFLMLMINKAKKLNSQISLINSYKDGAELYEKMGLDRTAITFADSALSISMVDKEIVVEKEIREIKQRAYERLGNMSESLQEAKHIAVLKDSLLSEENRLMAIDFEIRYEVEKKNQQLDFQQERMALLNESNVVRKKANYWLGIGAGLLGLLLLVLYNRFRMKRKAALNLKEKNNQIEQKNEEINKVNSELEKRLLRAQMNPHFVFNSLSAIQGFILENDKESAITYLDKFSKLIRRVLDQTSSVMVPLSEEIKLLEYYIQLETIRFEDQFEHTIEIDEDIDPDGTEIPFLLLQPYVENAIQHGFKYLERKGKLEIQLIREEETILCRIKDNGVGRSEAKRLESGHLKNHKSVGMSVSQRRLELINNQHKMTTSIAITDLMEQDQSAGTMVEVRIPIQLKVA